MAPMPKPGASSFIAAIAAAAALLFPSPLAAREWVAFDAEPTSAAAPALELRAQLFRPPGDGRYPAVVMLHGCRGIRPFQAGWAQKLAGWGYVVLLVDSFMTRHDADVCGHLDHYAGDGRSVDRVGDALGALRYLSAQPFVDPQRVAVMGWAYDAVLRALAAPRAENEPAFVAAVAVSPACRGLSTERVAAPALVLIGAADTWTPAADCERLAAARKDAASPVELVIYPGAGHGFDDPDLIEPLVIDHAVHPQRPGHRGATLAYDAAGHADSIEQVRGFLARHAPSGWDPAYALGGNDNAGESRAEWAVDPYQPGEDLPRAGRSAFDRLFTVVRDGEPVYALPFPFEALIQRIRATLAPGREGISPVKQVLIPLGRSLQRHAAAPEFFRYPRVVVAVDGEPEPGEEEPAFLLKDRLFLGYQERSETIEVISYNEILGRFEFQLVKNYGAGKTPQVVYANRAICVSCHQNAGPVFALFPWDETNGNRSVAARLARVKPSFHGVAAFPGSVPAATIDASTDRASLVPAYQRLWAESCADGDGESARRCRARALVAMLQYRLSGSLHFDRDSDGYRREFLDVAMGQWRQRWPLGLKVPNPDLRNREPVFAHPDIPALFDPLNLRPPLEIWSGLRARDVERLITGLAESLPAVELERLHAHLRRARAGGAGASVLESDCRVAELVHSGGVIRIRADCAPEGAGPGLEGSVRVRDGSVVDGTLARLSVPGGASIFQLSVRHGRREIEGGAVTLTFEPRQPRTGFEPRLADGRTISGITLRYRPFAGGESLSARLEVRLSDEFRLVERAVSALLLRDDANGHFFARPFRGPRVMQALHDEMGIPAARWCCDQSQAMPAARAEGGLVASDVAGLATVQDSASVRVLYRHCAGCHRSDTPVPPNFLSGDALSVRARLEQCAPRIYFRLSMWSQAPQARPVTPMPPVASLSAHGIDPRAWPQSSALATLRDYARRLYESGPGSETAAALLDRDYAKLRTCVGG